MMKKFSLVFVCLSMCTFSSVFAQQVHGCLLPSNTKVIYTQKIDGLLTSLINLLLGGSALYDETTFQEQSSPNCNYTFASATTSCKVCPGGLTRNILGGITGCNGGFITGYEGYFVVECDLDAGIPILLLACAVMAVLKLPKNKQL